MVMEESLQRGCSSRLSLPEVTMKQNQSVLSSNTSVSNNVIVNTASLRGALHSPAGVVIAVLELFFLYPEIPYDKREEISS